MDSYRIFIVEDDAVIARVVRTHLASWGYTVQCAEDFDNVLGEFTAFAPQLVLLDISLPFSMAITGVLRSAGFPTSPSSFSPQPQTI